MPEGPETLHQVDFINGLFKGGVSNYTLIQVKKITKRFRFDINDFKTALDQQVISITCKGKFYFLHFGGGVDVVCHQGMKGKWSDVENSNSHVELAFMRHDADDNDDEAIVLLYFNNVRLGDFQVYVNKSDHVANIKNSLAGDFIGDHQITVETFLKNFDQFTHRKRLRDILFDQHGVCSGLGNYLIAEIMYEMRLHPDVKAGKLTKVMRVALFETCRNIVRGFYAKNRAKVVYGQEIDPLGNAVEQKTVGGRTAHWVPKLQTIGA